MSERRIIVQTEDLSWSSMETVFHSTGAPTSALVRPIQMCVGENPFRYVPGIEVTWDE